MPADRENIEPIVSSNRLVSAESADTKRWNVVKIALTEEQREALTEITGERIDELNIQVEDLVDLADLIAN